jgi:hypothetical protein
MSRCIHYRYVDINPIYLVRQPSFKTSVADPDLSDTYDFGPPGAVSQRYRSGSGSFYHQAKIVRKSLIPTVL